MKDFAAARLVGEIPRLEDLPYAFSPPVQFVYESTAPLVLGVYTWADPQSVLTPNRPIMANTVYYFRNVSLAADVAELDFTAAIVTTPTFYMYRRADARAVLFREPLQMGKFFDQFDYRLCWVGYQDGDQLFAGFQGTLVQTAALVGKVSITLKAVVTAQEIGDSNFVDAFQRHYPKFGG
jgi:hypothetical protein